MANFYTASNFALSPVVYTGGTVIGGVVTNVLDYLHPSRKVIFNAAGTVAYVTFDFGPSPPNLAGVFIENTNAGTVTIKADADDSSWGAPSYNTSFQMAPNPWSSRIKGFITLGWTPAYRFMRVCCGAGVTEDGTNQWSVGTVLPVISGTLWPINTGNPFGYSPQEDTAGDPNEPVLVSPRYTQIFMTGTVMNATLYGIMQNLLVTYGTTRAFLFYRNRDSSNATERAEAYILRRRTAAKIEFTRPNVASMGQVMFEEVR